MRIDFHLDYALPVPFRIRRTWKKINVYENILNKNRFFNSFALFRRKCRSAKMKGVRIDYYLNYAIPVPFRIHRIWKHSNVCKSINK